MTEAPAPPAPISRVWLVTGPALLVVVVTAIVLLALPVPYLAFFPGEAYSVEPLIEVRSVPGGPTVEVDEADDDLRFLTVKVRETSGLMALHGLLVDDVQVEPSKPYRGNQSSSENRRLNQELMVNSQDKARKVALERLGFEVESESIGAFIADVSADLPAADVLKPGMTVFAVDGEPITDRQGLVAALERHRPGDEVSLEVLALLESERRTVTTTLVARPGDPDRPMLGVSVEDRTTYQFPLDIRIDTDDVGGPSAGLAFTLAILDRLTPGDLTGQDRVALTGTIEVDGSVGPVGGVRHKAVAALRSGATLFLVPPQELDEAEAAVEGEDIDVEAVASIDDALEILRQRGGAPLPDLVS